MEKVTHILVIPFPIQGHINPMLEFSKRLISKGSIKLTLVTTNSTFTSMHCQTTTTATCSINIEAISDGYEDGNQDILNQPHLQCFETVFPQNLTKLIEKHRSSPHPVKFIIYDSVLPWILKVARSSGLDGAPFFTQSCSVTSIYHLFLQGRFEVPSKGSAVSLPSMPLLGFDDLPGFVQDSFSFPGVRNLILSQFSNIEEPSWLFCNAFDKLENEVRFQRVPNR